VTRRACSSRNITITIIITTITTAAGTTIITTTTIIIDAVRPDLNNRRRGEIRGVYPFHDLRKRDNRLGDDAVTAEGEKSLLDIGEHGVDPLAEHLGRGR
jgi:hypothetical protein